MFRPDKISSDGAASQPVEIQAPAANDPQFPFTSSPVLVVLSSDFSYSGPSTPSLSLTCSHPNIYLPRVIYHVVQAALSCA